MSRQSRIVVALRMSTLSVTTLALSAGAHVVAGGHLASPALLGALGVILLPAALPLAHRALRPLPLLIWAAAAQAAIHVLLTWLHPLAGTSVAIHAHHGLQATDVLATGAHGSGSTMLLAHLLGTAVTVTALIGLERSASTVLRRWRRVRESLTMRPAPGEAALIPTDPVGLAPLTRLDDLLVRHGP